jgi:hypothetical protein
MMPDHTGEKISPSQAITTGFHALVADAGFSG